MVTAMTQYSSNIGYRAIAQAVNDNVLIMPMIETREGVENVEWVGVAVSAILRVFRFSCPVPASLGGTTRRSEALSLSLGSLD
jgi:2-keto-3-deoxy-L-rhamnonate aldolase RhmA